MSQPLGGCADSCVSCGKSCYEMEKIAIDGKAYHKTCFTCAKCHKILKLNDFSANAGQNYCTPHYSQLFKVKGNYTDGFQKCLEDSAKAVDGSQKRAEAKKAPARKDPTTEVEAPPPDLGLNSNPAASPKSVNFAQAPPDPGVVRQDDTASDKALQDVGITPVPDNSVLENVTADPADQPTDVNQDLGSAIAGPGDSVPDESENLDVSGLELTQTGEMSQGEENSGPDPHGEEMKPEPERDPTPEPEPEPEAEEEE